MLGFWRVVASMVRRTREAGVGGAESVLMLWVEETYLFVQLLSVPNKSKPVSEIDAQRWESPLTPNGLRLGEPDFTVQVHEAGLRTFGREWDHRGVCSPYWRLYYNFDPGSEVRAEGKTWRLAPERVLLVPEGVVFDCVGGERARHLWIHFSTRPAAQHAIVAVPTEEPLTGMLQRLADELRRVPREARRLQRWSTAVIHTGLALGQVEPQTPPPRLRVVLAAIERGLGGPLSNDALARTVGLSVEAFIRWFRAETGRTPAVYVAQERVREASRRLIFTDDSIEQIAEAVGFANRHHFTRVFTRYANCAPAAFRRAAKP